MKVNQDYMCLHTAHPLTFATGGLSTSFSSVKANLALSIGVALTGKGLPIALSYVLQQLAGGAHFRRSLLVLLCLQPA